MAATHKLQDLAKLAGDFVVKRRGAWNHEQWEALRDKVVALGLEQNDSLDEHLGLLLEQLRIFYQDLPQPARTKAKAKTKAKRKTKAKAKTKTKAKAAAKAASPE